MFSCKSKVTKYIVFLRTDKRALVFTLGLVQDLPSWAIPRESFLCEMSTPVFVDVVHALLKYG